MPEDRNLNKCQLTARVEILERVNEQNRNTPIGRFFMDEHVRKGQRYA